MLIEREAHFSIVLFGVVISRKVSVTVTVNVVVVVAVFDSSQLRL